MNDFQGQFDGWHGDEHLEEDVNTNDDNDYYDDTNDN